MSPTPTSGNLSPADAALLLDHLIGDAAFRSLFVTDAVAALSSIGIDAGNHTACLAVDALASPEELQAVRTALEAYLSGSTSAMNIIFCFEAGKIGETIS